ncbi:putative RNA recognition motif containing protein [Lyophyllum shimeji]|uniref:RNA recognition motif containing protein n=1 Tax=Lyophyllum shimeji TaxID=47721 RepID=A0A9P3PMP3_LYOSH|nr:putative RNA recognition motif containing protein [Lyophyllum shimeji]
MQASHSESSSIQKVRGNLAVSFPTPYVYANSRSSWWSRRPCGVGSTVTTMSTYPVEVSGISQETTEAQLHDFFTFCGKINRIEHPEQGKAVIHFEKPSAAKTATILNGGTLGGSTLAVESDSITEVEESASKDKDGHPPEQHDKPRAGIAAEYLAKGYTLSDQVLQRAIELDHKQGISKRFLDYIHSLDTSLGARALGPDQTISAKVQETVNTATQQAKSLDEKKGLSKTANDYYAKAISSPLGQKVWQFYTSTSKQVQDIHEEARRIAEQHKAAASSEKASSTSGSEAQPTPVAQAAPTVV